MRTASILTIACTLLICACGDKSSNTGLDFTKAYCRTTTQEVDQEGGQWTLYGRCQNGEVAFDADCTADLAQHPDMHRCSPGPIAPDPDTTVDPKLYPTGWMCQWCPPVSDPYSGTLALTVDVCCAPLVSE
jgi:hypothetical protein